MKKIFIIAISILLIASSCKKEKVIEKKIVDVTQVKLSKKNITLIKGTIQKLNASIIPEDAENQGITWSSSDESKVIVNKKGVVRALDLGIAEVTAEATNGIKAICKVGVIEDPELISAINLSSDRTEIYAGETLEINAAILPESAKNTKLIWSSSDSELATVDFNGNVHSKSKGTITVTATSEEGISGKIEITILPIVSKSGFRISPRITISPKFPKKVNIHMQYYTTGDKDIKIVSWESSDASKVDVYKNEKGEVSDNYDDPSNEPALVLKEDAINGDKITITATREDGLTSECVVTVNTDENYERAIGMWGDMELITYVGVDKPLIIDANNSHSDDFDKGLLFFSSDESILTIGDDKMIHPKKVGMATITTFSVDHGKFFQCVVTVKDPNE